MSHANVALREKYPHKHIPNSKDYRLDAWQNIKRHLMGLIILLLSASLPAHSSLTINADAIRRSVVFIYPAGDAGAVDATKPLGTGFLVFVPYKNTNGVGGGYLLLITARHILQPAWAGCPTANPDRVYLRLNSKKYDQATSQSGIVFVPVDLAGQDKHTKMVLSSDAQIDAAVVALNPTNVSLEKYDFKTISVSDFASAEELGKLATGDSIVSAGLVPGAQGERRNYPVFKFGEISTLLDEPFVTGCVLGQPATIPVKVWLLSINLFPGASGSAIFYTPPGSGGMTFGAPVNRPALIGVQSSSIGTSDVAAMTPIEPVFKIIEEMNLPNADLFRGKRPAVPPPPVQTPTAPTPK
jgi:Trypsin-like peptidase domain